MIHKKATWTGEGGVSRISSAGARNSRSLRFIPGSVLNRASAREANSLAAERALSPRGRSGNRGHAAISAGWL